MHSLAQRRRFFLLGACLALFGAASFAHASPPRRDSARAGNAPEAAGRDPFALAVDAQRTAITRENSTPSAMAWAGDYYAGDGLGANISMSLASHAGVAAAWQGCLGTYAINKGNVVAQSDGSLRLEYEQPNDPKSIGFADHVLPVAWGERMYLIPESQLPAFASAVNLGSEPREEAPGSFLMRNGDERREVRGLPDLPPAQRSLIRDVPLDVGVVSVKRLPDVDPHHYECRFRLELAHGASDRLAEGMDLDPAESSTGGRVTLERTTPTRAIATMTLYGDECTTRARQPSIATRLTTGAYRGTSSSAKP